MSNYRSTLVGLALITMASVLPSSAQAQQRSKVGSLSCRLAPSIGLIIGSSQRMTCRFTPDGRFPSETYVGVMNRIGLDIGITAGGALGWAVFASTSGPARGALAGRYVGASGEIGVGVGVGANALFGGSGNTISLQPLSVEGSVGLNLALGVAGLTLTLAR
jgi:uncharacterized protein DUF992